MKPLAVIACVILCGCGTASDRHIRSIARGEINTAWATQFDDRANDYVTGLSSRAIQWLVLGGGAVGALGGGSLVGAWRKGRKTGRAEA